MGTLVPTQLTRTTFGRCGGDTSIAGVSVVSTQVHWGVQTRGSPSLGCYVRLRVCTSVLARVSRTYDGGDVLLLIHGVHTVGAELHQLLLEASDEGVHALSSGQLLAGRVNDDPLQTSWGRADVRDSAIQGVGYMSGLQGSCFLLTSPASDFWLDTVSHPDMINVSSARRRGAG